MHGPLQGHTQALLASGEGMAFIARCHALVVARAACAVEVLVSDVREGNRIELARGELLCVGLQEPEIRLIALESFGLVDSRYLCLPLGIVTARTIGGTGIGHVRMATDALPMGGLRQRRHVVYSLGKMAVSTGGFFALGVEELFRFLVVFVVATFAFVAHAFDMTVVKRTVETDEAAGGNELGPSLMAVSAKRRAGFQSGRGRLVMTDHTILMVDIHDGVFVRVGQSKKFLGLPVVHHPRMAGVAVLSSFDQGRGVLVVWEVDGGSIELAECRHEVYRDEVRSWNGNIGLTLSTSTEAHACRRDDSNRNDPERVWEISFAFHLQA